MNSLYFGLSLVAICLVLRWYITNDGKSQNDGSIGLFAMNLGKPVPSSSQETPAKTRSFRRKS